MTVQELASQFISFINEYGHIPSKWYVGITSDPKRRLFIEHQVSPTSGIFKYADASTVDNARLIEKFLIDKMKIKGGSGGGDSTTTWVYVYMITPLTLQ